MGKDKYLFNKKGITSLSENQKNKFSTYPCKNGFGYHLSSNKNGIRVISMGGATEAAIWSNMFEVKRNWDPTSNAGEAWTTNGFYAVLWQYVGVVAVLAKLYVSLAIYYFFYGIISSLVKWIKSPYLPFRTN